MQKTETERIYAKLGYVAQFTYELEHINDNVPTPNGNFREINKMRLELITALQTKVQARLNELQPFILLAKSDKWYRVTGVPNPRHAKQFSELYPEYLALRKLRKKLAKVRNTVRGNTHKPLGYKKGDNAIWVKQYWANRKATENANT